MTNHDDNNLEPSVPEALQSPPDDILTLLSAYVDGELVYCSDTIELLEFWIAHSETVRADFFRLKQLKDQIVGTLQEQQYAQSELSMPDFWQDIETQLDVDYAYSQSGNAPRFNMAMLEFTSAYVDQEVERDSAQTQSFEASLNSDRLASECLASLSQLSGHIRSHANRLQASCSIDIVSKVMALYGQAGLDAGDADIKSAVNESPLFLDTEKVIQLSAYLDDDGISEKDKSMVSQWLETDADCKRFTLFMQKFQERLPQITAAIEQQKASPLDAAALVARSMAQPLPANGLPPGMILPFDSAKKRLAARPLKAISAIAASVMLLFATGQWLSSNGFLPDANSNNANHPLSLALNAFKKPPSTVLASNGSTPSNALSRQFGGTLASGTSMISADPQQVARTDAQNELASLPFSTVLGRSNSPSFFSSSSPVNPAPRAAEDGPAVAGIFSGISGKTRGASGLSSNLPLNDRVVGGASTLASFQAADSNFSGPDFSRESYNIAASAARYGLADYNPVSPAYVVHSVRGLPGSNRALTFVSAYSQPTGAMVNPAPSTPVQTAAPIVAARITPISNGGSVSRIPTSEAYLIELLQEEDIPTNEMQVLYDL